MRGHTHPPFHNCSLPHVCPCPSPQRPLFFITTGYRILRSQVVCAHCCALLRTARPLPATGPVGYMAIQASHRPPPSPHQQVFIQPPTVSAITSSPPLPAPTSATPVAQTGRSPAHPLDWWEYDEVEVLPRIVTAPSTIKERGVIEIGLRAVCRRLRAAARQWGGGAPRPTPAPRTVQAPYTAWLDRWRLLSAPTSG